MDGPLFFDHACKRGPRPRALRSATPELGKLRRHADHRLRAHEPGIEAKQHAKTGVADAHRVLQHGLEDRLKVALRTRDDLQHFGGRRLLLACLFQLLSESSNLFLETRNR